MEQVFEKVTANLSDDAKVLLLRIRDKFLFWMKLYMRI